MHPPGLVRHLRDPQVHARAGQRERRRLTQPGQHLQPPDHRVQRVPHSDVEISVEPERHAPPGRLRVNAPERPPRRQPDDQRGRHRAFDGGPADLPVALRGVPVAQVEQGAGHRDGQVQRGPGDQFPAVDVPAGRSARRYRRVLPGLGRRHAHHAQERRQRPGEPLRGPPQPGGGVEFPQQPRRRPLGQPETPHHRRVPAAGHRPAPLAGPQRQQPQREHVARLGSAHLDRAGQAVPAGLRDQLGLDLAGKGLPGQVPGGVQRADGDGVARVHGQDGSVVAGEDVPGGPGRRVEPVAGHDPAAPFGELALQPGQQPGEGRPDRLADHLAARSSYGVGSALTMTRRAPPSAAMSTRPAAG